MLDQSQKGRATSSAQDATRENDLKTAFKPELPVMAATTNIAPSLISEFTKRRNWSQRILEDLKDFLHILSPEGRIQYVSQGNFEVTGYKAEELQDRFIVDFIHPDDSALYIREFNESIASGNALRFYHRFRKADGSYVIFESHGHPHLTSEAASFAGAGVARFCRGFFMLSRPYPTKNALLLDSFLEHKIENERLRKRIADLKREEREETENMQQQRLNKSDGNATPSDVRTMSDGPTTNSLSPSSYQSSGMMPPPPPRTMDTALTQQNLNEALASSKPDSIKDKMARYEGGTHVESIEMFTGLRYREGERSLGISTGGSSPALIRGDVGIAIPSDKDSRNDKRKRLKLADEYVCTICATLDSPEWRKGPAGPKTLCNACGLRWAKQEKKLNP